MNRRAVSLIALLIITGVVIAQNRVYVGKDKQGGVNVEFFAKSWSATFLGENRYSFRALQFIGKWKNPIRELKAADISGKFSRGDEGVQLESADLDGGVDVLLNEPSSSAKVGEFQKVHLISGKATYSSTSQQWSLSNGVSVERDDRHVQQRMFLTGQSAKVQIHDKQSAAGRSPFSFVSIDGGVQFQSVTPRRVINEKTKQQETKLFSIKGKADRAVYDDSKATLVLIGNVQLSGDDPTLMGDMFGSKITVTFDKTGQPVQVDGEGEPGKSSIQKSNLQKGGGSSR